MDPQIARQPGHGPVLTETHAFVPMLNGVLEGYVLATRDRQTPWIYQSTGRIFNQPVIRRRPLVGRPIRAIFMSRTRIR